MSKNKSRNKSAKGKSGPVVTFFLSETVTQAMEHLEDLAAQCQSGAQGVIIDNDEAPYVAAHIRVVLSELRERVNNYVIKPEVLIAQRTAWVDPAGKVFVEGPLGGDAVIVGTVEPTG